MVVLEDAVEEVTEEEVTEGESAVEEVATTEEVDVLDPALEELFVEEFTAALTPVVADVSAAFALCAMQKAQAAVAILIIVVLKITQVLLFIFISPKFLFQNNCQNQVQKYKMESTPKINRILVFGT